MKKKNNALALSKNLRLLLEGTGKEEKTKMIASYRKNAERQTKHELRLFRKIISRKLSSEQIKAILMVYYKKKGRHKIIPLARYAVIANYLLGMKTGKIKSASQITTKAWHTRLINEINNAAKIISEEELDEIKRNELIKKKKNSEHIIGGIRAPPEKKIIEFIEFMVNQGLPPAAILKIGKTIFREKMSSDNYIRKIAETLEFTGKTRLGNKKLAEKISGSLSEKQRKEILNLIERVRTD